MHYIKNIAVIFFLILSSFQVQAETELKLADSVAEVIKVLKAEVGAPISGIMVQVDITYEMLKPCRNLIILGKSISKDGVELQAGGASQRSDVSVGDKFKETYTPSYEPGHSFVIDEVTCT